MSAATQQYQSPILGELESSLRRFPSNGISSTSSVLSSDETTSPTETKDISPNEPDPTAASSSYKQLLNATSASSQNSTRNRSRKRSSTASLVTGAAQIQIPVPKSAPSPASVSNSANVTPLNNNESNSRNRIGRSNSQPHSCGRPTSSSTPNMLYPSASTSLHPTESNNTSNNKQSTGSGMTLWKLLMVELNIPALKDKSFRSTTATTTREDTLISSELLLNFIKLPVYLESFMSFGLLYCTIVVLKMLTIVPLRFLIHSYSFIKAAFFNKDTRLDRFSKLKNDLISVLLIMISLYHLRGMDSSRIYHNIRSGTAVKLYFMVSALEIADKLLSAVGQDILKILYQLNITSLNYKQMINFSVVFGITICYLTLHSYVLVYQVMALNVAINSYSNALLTLILSNQFAELKGAVFKRSEREGLFQISCADLNERFQLFLMLLIISSRNLFQIFTNNTSNNGLFNNLKPHSWYSQLTFSKKVNDWIGLLMGPMFIVIGSEVLVDWLKHSYIAKFNRIKPKIYQRFTTILSTDYVNSFKSNLSTTHSNANCNDSANDEYPEMLLRRTGLPLFTIVVVLIKMAIYPWIKYSLYHHEDGNNGVNALGLLLIVFAFSLVVFLRLILSLIVLQWSNKILRSAPNKQQIQLQPFNDFVKGNPNVTLTNVNSNSTRKLFYDEDEKIPPSLEEIRAGKVLKSFSIDGSDGLDSVTRFDMADKLIW